MLIVAFIFQETVDKYMYLKHTIKRLKDEILFRDVLVLNNSSCLQVYYNKISSIDVLLSFYPSNIPFVYLNDYNFGMITFISKTQSSPLDTNNETELTHNSMLDMSKSEYLNLQYVY